MAIEHCLSATGLRPQELGCVAVNADPRARRLAKLGYALRSGGRPALLWSRLRHRRQRANLGEALNNAGLGFARDCVIEPVEHHTSHLASAALACGWDEVVAVSMDGFGDFASSAWGVCTKGALALRGEVRFPHSAGVLYQAVTQYLGFTAYGDEYKVMGLAGSGDAGAVPELDDMVELRRHGEFRLALRFFRHHREAVSFVWSDGTPRVGTLFSDELTELLGPPRAADEPLTARHRDVAAALQRVYEKIFFHVLEAAAQCAPDTRRLALAGGCALNSLANGSIRSRSPFEAAYVPPAAGDAGGAVGAGLTAWLRRNPGSVIAPVDHAYLGPEVHDGQIAATIAEAREALQTAGCVVEERDDASLFDETAAIIADGGVVGWFQGRAEWGPRALGNRSILADPRRVDMRETLNRKIKLRESFRPFAPAVLEDAAHAWFERGDAVPFMTEVVPVRPERRRQVPAIVHVDGTGRLQTVSARTNPRFHGLIEAFQRKTGVPMLLNTSFNENEPIVTRPAEALSCFLRTGMDRLVLGNTVIRRRG